jgi:hypothetical protein
MNDTLIGVLSASSFDTLNDIAIIKAYKHGDPDHDSDHG